MSTEDIQYPIYRKYSTGRNYFKILEERKFEELQLFGSRCSRYVIEAKTYPEWLRIQDMIACKDDLWSVIDAEAYQEVAANCPEQG